LKKEPALEKKTDGRLPRGVKRGLCSAHDAQRVSSGGGPAPSKISFLEEKKKILFGGERGSFDCEQLVLVPGGEDVHGKREKGRGSIRSPNRMFDSQEEGHDAGGKIGKAKGRGTPWEGEKKKTSTLSGPRGSSAISSKKKGFRAKTADVEGGGKDLGGPRRKRGGVTLRRKKGTEGAKSA